MQQPKTIFQLFASRTWGGGERFVCDLARRQIADGMRVVFISRKSEVLRNHTAEFGMPHTELPLKGAADLLSAMKIARLIVRESPSVIHLHHFKDLFTVAVALKLSRLSGCKARPAVIVTRHLARKGKGGLFYRYIYRNVNRIVFVSEFARRAFLSSQPPVDTGKTTVIRNTVPDFDPAAVAASDLRTRFGIDPDIPLLLFCGRLCGEKGVDILLDGCTRLAKRSFALVIVGTGDAQYVDKLQHTVKQAGLGEKVFFYGFSDAVPALMRQADIVAIPSTVAEAGSLVLLEAMQAGCAVVATDGGSQPEFIEQRADGLLVPPSDAEALAASLAELIDNKELRIRMGAAAAEKFRNGMSYDKFYEQYAALYNECSCQHAERYEHSL